MTKEIHAVTMIDNATTWPEVVPLEGKKGISSSKEVQCTMDMSIVNIPDQKW